MGCPDTRLYVAEWFVTDLTEHALSTTLAGMVGEVRVTMTLSIPADEVVFAVFAAPSAEAVRAACSGVALPAPLRLSVAVAETYARVTE